MEEVINSIAAELLCPLSNTLPIAPVLCEDGQVYEKDAVAELRNKSNPFSVPLISKSPVHSKLRIIVEKLVSTGKVRDEYLGSWTSRNQAVGGASNGDCRSMVELGEMYLKGNAGGDAAKAFELFVRASELEDEIGTARKADCLLTGAGVEKDFDEGYRILIEAAQIDESAHATLRLMYFYRDGILGFPQDDSKEAKWTNRMKELLPELSEPRQHEMISKLKAQLSYLTNPPLEAIENFAGNETDDDLTEDNETEESDITSQLNSEVSNAVSEYSVKKCSECEQSKPKSYFSASQWKKKVGTGKCSLCVSKLPARQTIHQETTICCNCRVTKTFQYFTSTQWKKKVGERRCFDCCTKRASPNQPSTHLL